MKIELEVTFINGTLVVTNQTTAPNALVMAYGDIVAAGSPRSVAEELKRRFVEVLDREKRGETTGPKRLIEMTEQGD